MPYRTHIDESRLVNDDAGELGHATKGSQIPGIGPPAPRRWSAKRFEIDSQTICRGANC
jgi:hypothetical protein